MALKNTNADLRCCNIAILCFLPGFPLCVRIQDGCHWDLHGPRETEVCLVGVDWLALPITAYLITLSAICIHSQVLRQPERNLAHVIRTVW